MITICFDFGNTRLKYALFKGDELYSMNVLEQGDVEEITAVLEKHKPERSILSSVINHDPVIEELLSSKTTFHKLSHLSRLPFTAAVKFYPGMNNLVIGLGTAVTYNFINKYNEFLGGGISPGVELRLKSLND